MKWVPARKAKKNNGDFYVGGSYNETFQQGFSASRVNDGRWYEIKRVESSSTDPFAGEIAAGVRWPHDHMGEANRLNDDARDPWDNNKKAFDGKVVVVKYITSTQDLAKNGFDPNAYLNNSNATLPSYITVKSINSGRNFPSAVKYNYNISTGTAPNALYSQDFYLDLIYPTPSSPGIHTGIDDLTSDDVTGQMPVSTQYVNMAGQVSSEPFPGVNIVRTTWQNGTTTTRKELH